MRASHTLLVYTLDRFLWKQEVALEEVAVLAILVILHRQELGIMLERLKNE